MSTTANYGWTKPTIDGDADTWGAELNATLDGIDTTVKSVSNTAAYAAPTGAVMDFLMAAPPTGWLALNGDTIGDATSGATSANAANAALFAVLWALSNTASPILDSAGSASTRGASATADFAAHKRLTLPNMSGRFRRMTGGSAGNLGEQQADALKTHTHTFQVAQGGTFAGSGDVTSLQGTTTPAGGNYNGTTGNPSTGTSTETRPINIAFLTCIKV
jgi:hypothetical protein